MALHAVEPNLLTSRLGGQPHRGQRGEHATWTGPEPGRGPDRLWSPTGAGGAIPASTSLRRPSSVIQSVVQAGESSVRTSTAVAPRVSTASRTSAAIASIAGQPE